MSSDATAGGKAAEPRVRVTDLGRIAYPAFLEVQRRAVRSLQASAAGSASDGDLSAAAGTLFFAEHDPVLTSGRDGGEDQILVGPEVLARKGIPVVVADRGGSITYHGPGQLMIYPVLDLGRFGSDAHLHLWRLEEAVIRTLAGWGIPAARREGYPGVWTLAPGPAGSPANGGLPGTVAKIAAIGIALAKGVTSHGAALNLDPDLGAFGLINPCGLAGVVVTSVRALTGRTPDRAEAIATFSRHFAGVYGVSLRVAKR